MNNFFQKLWKSVTRNKFENYCGIFNIPIFRTILDTLIYVDEYDEIDSNLTDSNVGARKNRNIRDEIFVLNTVMNSVVYGKEEPVDIQIFDIEKRCKSCGKNPNWTFKASEHKQYYHARNSMGKSSLYCNNGQARTKDIQHSEFYLQV